MPSGLEPATLCPILANHSHHSTHNSLFRSALRVSMFRSHKHTSDVSRILYPRLASSTTCNLRLLRNQIVVTGVTRVPSHSRVARRSPRCHWPSRAEWKRLVVVGQWASHLAASTTQRHRNWSRIEETRHLKHSACTYHTLRLHCTQAFTQECCYSQES